MPCLISTSGHLLEFRKFPSRFGTSTDNELVVQDSLGVMAHHFTLRREGVRIVLESTGQGVTTVNGNDVRRANIRDGDRIQVGQLMLIYSNPSGQQTHYTGEPEGNVPMALPAPASIAIAENRDRTLPIDSPSPNLTPPAQAAAWHPLASQLEGMQSPSPHSAPGIQEGIPTVSDTTPSESFLAWAKAAEPEPPLFAGAHSAPLPTSGPPVGATSAPAWPTAAATPPQSAPAPATSGFNPFNPFDPLAAKMAQAPVQPTAMPGTPSHHSPPTDAVPAQPTPSAIPGPMNAAMPEPQPSVAPPANPTAPVNPFNTPVNSTTPVNPFDPRAPIPADNAETPLASSPSGVPFQTTPIANTPLHQEPAPTNTSPSLNEDLLAFFHDDENVKPTPANDGGEDLASVFFSEDAPPVTPSAPVQVPALPDFSEAEKSGAVAEASAPPSKDINPIGSLVNKRKPSPPPPAVPVETTTTKEPPKKMSKLAERQALHRAKPTREKRDRRRSREDVADRLSDPKLSPKYGLQIPWHKVAIFLCVLFGGAGAYLATNGQSYVDKYMAKFGLRSESGHHSFLPQLASVNPNFILTADANRIVDFYRKWAAEENWKTVGDLEKELEDMATKMQLSNLEHVTLATDSQGEFVAIVSTKTDFNRQNLMRDLGRGVLVSERVGPLVVYDGFINKSHTVKFAVLNPRTMVIGDPNIVMGFIKAPTASSLSKNPARILADSPKDVLGMYHTREGLQVVRTLLPESVKPTLDRVLALAALEEADDVRVLTQIGGDLRIEGLINFATEAKAAAFAQSWSKQASERLDRFLSLLGPQAPRSFEGAAKDLDRCTVVATGREASLNLETTNRWATLGSLGIKDALVHLVGAFQKQLPNKAPALMSLEETEARAVAQRIAEKFELAMAAGTTDVSVGHDIGKLIDAMNAGVRGGGVYRKVSYRVDQASKYKARLLQLLQWQGDTLVVVLSDPPVPKTTIAAQPDAESDQP